MKRGDHPDARALFPFGAILFKKANISSYFVDQEASDRALTTGDKNSDAQFQKSTIRLLVFSIFIGGLVGGMTMPLLPLFLISRGFSIIELGWTVTLISLSVVFTHQVAYRLYNHLKEFRVLAWLSAVPGMLLPAYLFVDAVWEIVGLILVGACVSSITYPAVQARGAALAKTAGPTPIFARLGMFHGLTFAGGILLGAAMLLIGWPAVFWTAAGLATIGAIVVHFAAHSRANRENVQEPDPKQIFINEITGEGSRRTVEATIAKVQKSSRIFVMGTQEAQRRLLRQSEEWTAVHERRVRNLLLHGLLFHGAIVMFPFFIPLYFESYGISYSLAAAIMALGWIVYVPFQLLAPWFEKWASPPAMAVSHTMLLSGIFIFAMALRHFWIALAAWIAIAVFDGMGRPIRDSLVISSRRGAAGYLSLAWMDSAHHMARVFAPLLFATTIYIWGFTGGLVLAGLMMVLSAFPLMNMTGLWTFPGNLQSTEEITP